MQKGTLLLLCRALLGMHYGFSSRYNWDWPSQSVNQNGTRRVKSIVSKTAKFIIETADYKAIFNLKEFDEEWVDVVIKFALHPELGDLSLESVPEMVTFRDLHWLVDYFDQHVDGLRRSQDHISPVFLTHNFGFQIQALPGSVLIMENGEESVEFEILFLICIGQRKDYPRAFFGGQSGISGEQIKAFKESLYMALESLKNGP